MRAGEGYHSNHVMRTGEGYHSNHMNYDEGWGGVPQ